MDTSKDPARTSLLNDSIIPAAVLAASVLVVFPGLFDSSYTTRLALYPLLGSLLILAGRHRLSIAHLWALGGLTVIPVLSVAWAAIPIQSVVPIVRWLSLGLMVAGFGGIGWNEDRKRALFVMLVCAASAAAVLYLAVGHDYPAGNPNRLGPLLAVAAVMLVSGASGIRGVLRFALILLLLVGLYRTEFYIGWIAVVAGSAWFLIAVRLPRLHPGWLLLVFITGQVVFTIQPGIAGRTPPTMELRALVWRTSVEVALDDLPFGTGTGQARMDIYTDGPPALRELAGEERRIDFLHSDLLTLPVESGLPGLLLLGVFLLWILRTEFTAASGAILVAVWPFLASDLPLATPLGALPVALVFASSLRTGARRVDWGPVLPVVLLLASLYWAQSVTRGYSALDRGRREALYGNIVSPVGSFHRAADLIPFEERASLYLAQAQLNSGDVSGSLESIDRFCTIYPSYWRGWLLSGEIMGRLGLAEEAAASFMMAVKTSPENLPERPMLALNALAFPPEDQRDLMIISEALVGGIESGFRPPRIGDVAVDWSMRAGNHAIWTMEYNPLLGRIIMREVLGYILCTLDVIPPERYPEFDLILEAAELSGDSVLEEGSRITRKEMEVRTNPPGTVNE